MKVALVHWTLPPAVGGVETHLVNLANAYTEMGIKVIIVSGERRPSVQVFPSEVIFYFHGDLRRPLDSPKALGSLGQLLSSLGAQIIHAHNILPLGAQLLPEFQMVKRTGAALFHTSHSEWPGVEWPEDKSMWNEMFAVSDYMKDQLLRLGVSTTVTYPPVNVRAFTTGIAPLENNVVSLLQSSRLVEEKGCSLSLDLLEILSREGIGANLTLMETPQVFGNHGRTTVYANQIRRRIADSHLESSVRLVRADITEMPKIYENSDIVLCPSAFPEPYGLAALEAMSCARPVIVSAMGGMQANIRHGQTGLLFASGRIHDLHSWIKALIQHPNYARMIGKYGREYVIKNHSLDNFAQKMIDTYSKHIARPYRASKGYLLDVLSGLEQTASA